MFKVDNLMEYGHLFEDYDHNRAVIYACLRGQYACDLYVNQEENPDWAILFTPFDFHYLGGDSNTPNLEKDLETIIFKSYLLRGDKKEGVFFTPDRAWDQVLEVVFKAYKGIKDHRNIYYLDPRRFERLNHFGQLPPGIKVHMDQEQAQGSREAYPICRVELDGLTVASCAGFMTGQGHSEITITTEEGHRKKGYGRLAAQYLIDHLIDLEIAADWNTWPYRKASGHLAKSLGFDLYKRVPVHIWVEDHCGPLK